MDTLAEGAVQILMAVPLVAYPRLADPAGCTPVWWEGLCLSPAWIDPRACARPAHVLCVTSPVTVINDFFPSTGSPALVPSPPVNVANMPE